MLIKIQAAPLSDQNSSSLYLPLMDMLVTAQSDANTRKQAPNIQVSGLAALGQRERPAIQRAH